MYASHIGPSIADLGYSPPSWTSTWCLLVLFLFWEYPTFCTREAACSNFNTNSLSVVVVQNDRFFFTNYMAFKYFVLGCSWWRLFQKTRRDIWDIYVFIQNIHHSVWKYPQIRLLNQFYNYTIACVVVNTTRYSNTTMCNSILYKYITKFLLNRSWRGWKIVHLVLNNNYSLMQIDIVAIFIGFYPLKQFAKETFLII
jgi:hypothetical protein